MRLTLRFLVPLLVALGLFAYAAVPLVDALTTRWFVRDLDIRSNLIASTIKEPVEEMIRTGQDAKHDLASRNKSHLRFQSLLEKCSLKDSRHIEKMIQDFFTTRPVQQIGIETVFFSYLLNVFFVVVSCTTQY